MSTRAALFANPDTKPTELAESVGWIPLLWLTLPSADDVRRASDTAFIRSDRKQAIGRCSQTVPFLAKLFPEFRSIREAADDLLSLLKGSRSKTIGMEVADHAGMGPTTFFPALELAVAALIAKDERCAFTRPAQSIPILGADEPYKVPQARFKTTREVLCYAAALDPAPRDEAVQREQLIGYVLE